MNRLAPGTAVLVLAAGLPGCTKTIEMKMAVDVVSDPERAVITFKGKSIGSHPGRMSSRA